MAATYATLPHGITLIDTGFQRPSFDGAYLIVEEGRAAFVDTGPNAAVPRLMAALELHGLEPAAVDWVILTHVHLDHAGGAGALMAQLPRARLLVHPRGARHMIDPARMMQGVCAVYGAEAVRRDYGEVVPVPAQRIVTGGDGMTVLIAGRPLRLLDTPGHARHHQCIWDEASRGIFAGDTLGVAYPELACGRRPYGLPSSSPVQFDPAALHLSIDRLLSLAPSRAYLTHFGAKTEVERHAELIHAQIDDMVRLARTAATFPDGSQILRKALLQLYVEQLHACGNETPIERVQELLGSDIELNAQGLECWMSEARRRETATS